jgi:hypothetical protein
MKMATTFNEQKWNGPSVEPLENEVADAMLKIMSLHMPENGATYIESEMLWGFIWEEMRSRATEIIKAHS